LRIQKSPKNIKIFRFQEKWNFEFFREKFFVHHLSDNADLEKSKSPQEWHNRALSISPLPELSLPNPLFFKNSHIELHSKLRLTISHPSSIFKKNFVFLYKSQPTVKCHSNERTWIHPVIVYQERQQIWKIFIHHPECHHNFALFQQ